jgi:hypothetical protein
MSRKRIESPCRSQGGAHRQLEGKFRWSASVTPIAILVLLLSVFTGLALAGGEEGAPATPEANLVPPGVDTPGELASLAEGAEQVEADPAVDPLAAEELPHTGLDRSQAEELLSEVFGGGLEASAELLDELEVEAFRSDNVAVVAPPEPGADPGLLSSLLPLRAEDEQGNKQLIDLSLESEGDHLEPGNPLVPVEIPSQLSDGITFPGTGIVIDLANREADRQASEVGDATAFFPNVGPDSDFVVTAIPTGIETYTQLRSPEAPTSEVFDLRLPQGAELQETPRGAQVLDTGGAVILSISAPSAIDAEGTQVPVSVHVSSGNRVTVSVDPPAGAAYPILVDPVFENYTWMNSNSNTGIYTDWRSATQNQEALWPSWIGVWSNTSHAGLNLRSYAKPIAPGSQANWNYYVPRYFSDYENPSIAERPTSFIRNMTLSQVYFLIEEGAPVHTHPYMLVGLWDGNKGQFASMGTHNSAEGQYNGVSLQLPNPGEYTDVKNGGIALATSESTSYPRQAFVGGAWVELSDKDNPAFGELGSVPEWVSTKAGTPIKFKVTDPGIGIHNLRLEYTRATGIKAQPITGIGCTGSAGNPCPRTVSNGTKTIPYYPDLMPQGENWVNVYGVDAVDHWSEAGATRIKVDRAKPELATAGTLTEQAKVGVNLAEYGLDVSTVDGDETTAAATTPIGTAGTGAGQLERPQGVAVDGSGNTWVTDRTNQRVVEYDGEGKLLREIKAQGSANGQINEPRGVAVAANGNIWVAEAGTNKRIQQFSPTGTYVSKITNASFIEPWGVAVAPDGTIWVADPAAKKVFLFKEDGTLIRTINSNQPLGGGTPYGLDVDEFGNAWVTLQGTDQVMALNPEGESLVTFGGTGTEAGKFKSPVDVAIAPSGNIFVSDDLNSRIQEFRPGGLFMRQFGSLGSASNQLKEPRAIDATSVGNELMVADAGNKRIARWTHADRHPESGTVKTEVKVDGVLKDLYNPGCAEKNCKISRKWTLKADEYSVGTHTVEVIATDGVGLQTKKTLQVETHGDLQAPALALSGTMTEQATLGTTRPTYKLKAAATDPGSTSERKSGVASTSLKVDGVTVDSSSPGCPSGGCSITREWTLNSSSYGVGTHLVEAKATDAAGRSTTKVLSVKIERDTTAPQLNLSGTLPGAPEGWVQQESRSAIASTTDANGYGVKQIRFSIDGVQVGASTVGSCAEGGCSASQTFAINMANYSGGAHAAVVAVEDFAANIRKQAWTINVDPGGNISTTEATETLEALDETSPVNTVGDSQGEAAYEGTTENLFLDQEGGSLVGSGPVAPTVIPVGDPGAVTVEVPSDQQYADCPNRPAEESVAELTGLQEEELAQTAACEDEAVSNPDEPLEPIMVTPVGNIGGESQTVTENGAAAVANNVSPHVDLITRPLYDGAMIFSAIRDAAGAETFSWQLNLDKDQSLQLVDSHSARVVWNSGPTAFSILAVPAHDAIGTAVPTHLSVSSNVLTLTVEHRSSSFVYPVVGGAGWEGGFQTYQIHMPAGEGEAGEIEGGAESTEGFYRELTIGPPEPTDLSGAPLAAKEQSTPPKKRNYNFHECRFNPNGVDGTTPPGTPGNVHREGIHKCHGEENRPEGGYWALAWGVSVNGSYRYIPHKTVWINVLPECEKWGPEQPAKRDCQPKEVGVAHYPNLDVLGYYRFAPGNFGGSSPFLAACYRVNGVLPNYWKVQEGEEPDYRVLEETVHFAVEKVNKDDKCTWTDLKTEK